MVWLCQSPISLFLFYLTWIRIGDCCDLYLAPSKIKGLERGIFAGRSYPKDTSVDLLTSILITYEDIRGSQLSNYVFASTDSRIVIALFGSGMLFNHRNPKNVAYYYFQSNAPDASEILPLTYSEPYTTYPNLAFVAELDIEPFEEIFTSYGEPNWFSDRNITFTEPLNDTNSQLSYEELEKDGHCLSHIYVNHSTIPLAGKGVFTKRSYRKGEIVTISPVLFQSKKILSKLSDNSLLINYCICSEISDVCIIPIGLGGMINHGGTRANVDMHWYDWGSKEENHIPERLSWSPEDLARFPAAPLDIVYRATRNIDAGEEIFISYGASWENQWVNYLHRLQQWNKKYNAYQAGNYMKPQFRSTISAPSDFFPASWHQSDCIDRMGCKNNINQKKMNKRKKQMELKEIKMAQDYMNQ